MPPKPSKGLAFRASLTEPMICLTREAEMPSSAAIF